MAASCVNAGLSIAGHYNFGSPRGLSYDHVDFKRYLDRHCRLVTDMRMVDLLMDSFEGSLLGLRKLFDQVTHLKQQKLPLPDFIEDHRIENYISCIEKN